MQSVELERRLKKIREIASAADEVVLQYYNDNVNVEWKAPGDPVTAADHAANEVILTQLNKHFPGEAVLSEESTDDMKRLEQDLVWVVDPLDGTKEFISHNGEFSIMIGLVENGRPVLGVVSQSAAQLVYYGAPTVGAWQSSPEGTRDLKVSEKTEKSSLSMVASRSHFDPRVDKVRQQLGIEDIRRSGSVGLKCALIALGECEVYIHPSSRVNMWDSCGPAAILHAAGGKMTDLQGEPLDYQSKDVRHRQGLVATHGCLHDEIIKTIIDEGVTVTG